MTNNYFAIERNDKCIEHVCFRDKEDNMLFGETMEMTCQEIMKYEYIDNFVVCAMDAINEYLSEDDELTTITLIGEDGVFIWSVIIGTDDNGGLVYKFVDWKKDGKMYKYESDN